jgi:hypothetical protein
MCMWGRCVCVCVMYVCTTLQPHRWIRADDVSAMRTASADRGTRSAFLPFLDGQRQCAGRFLAELEFVAVPPRNE